MIYATLACDLKLDRISDGLCIINLFLIISKENHKQSHVCLKLWFKNCWQTRNRKNFGHFLCDF